MNTGFKPHFWSVTDIGTRRDKNEDAFMWLGPEQTQNRGWLWMVCDGMGGASAGELASSMVCQVVSEVYPGALAASGNPHQALREAFDAANRRLIYMQRERAVLHKMGTTAVAMAFFQGHIWVASIGDSRIYVLNDGKLRQITTDQTQFQKFLQAGVVRIEDSLNHPSSNVLVSALGRSSWEVDTLGDRSFEPENSTFLICSDGLSSFVSVSRIQQALEGLSAYDAANALVELARETSTDNITATVVQFHDRTPSTTLEAFIGKLAANVPRQLHALPPFVSYDFNPKDVWTDYQTGVMPIIAGIPADEGPVVAPSVVAPLGNADSAKSGVTGKGGIALNTVARQTIAEIKRDASKPKAPAAAVVEAALANEHQEVKRSKAAGVAIAVMLAATIGGLVYKQLSKPAPVMDVPQVVELPAPPEESTGPEAPTPHNEPLQGEGPVRFELRELGQFALPDVRRAPDTVHSVDAMPGYRIANGTMMMDAHEVTVDQFRSVLARSSVLKELHYEIDEPRYRNLPCSTGSPDAARDGREPVCVSPESASVYCSAVGRRLPSRADWRAMTAQDKSLVALGYGSITRYGSDGPPPPIPEKVDGIYGVWDGLPESLHASPLDLARGDVATLGASVGAAEPIIVDARLSARFLGQGISENARPMLGFRCVSDIEKPRRSVQVPQAETSAAAINRIHPVRVRMEGSPNRSTEENSPANSDSMLFDHYRDGRKSNDTP